MLCWKVNKPHTSLMNCFSSWRARGHFHVFIFVLTMDVKEVYKIFSCILNLRLGGAKDTIVRMKLVKSEGGKLLGAIMDALCITLNWGPIFVSSFLQCWKLGFKISKASSSCNDEVDYVVGPPSLRSFLCVWMFDLDVWPIEKDFILEVTFWTTITSYSCYSIMKLGLMVHGNTSPWTKSSILGNQGTTHNAIGGENPNH